MYEDVDVDVNVELEIVFRDGQDVTVNVLDVVVFLLDVEVGDANVEDDNPEV